GTPICLFRLGNARWPILAVLLIGVGTLVMVPVIGLVWKAGLAGSPEIWSGARVGQRLLMEWQGRGSRLLEYLVVDACTGVMTAVLALTACWLATESRWFRTFILILAAAAWALPGPIVGIGLKETIAFLMSAEEVVWFGHKTTGPFAALYYGPSP